MQLIIEKDEQERYILVHDMEDGKSAQSMIFEDSESVDKYLETFHTIHPDAKIMHFDLEQ